MAIETTCASAEGGAQKQKMRRGSYSQILKSSALIGGSSLINILIGVARTKAMALLLGPAGMGLMGVYASIQGLTQTFAGLGIGSSGVRQIAEAASSGQVDRLARTATALRWTSVALGFFGAVVLLVFAKPISQTSFGGAEHTGGVALLALAVLFALIAGGQGALIQGMRRIGDMARMGVISGALGAGVSVTLVILLGESGIVPSLVSMAAASIALSWWYSRKIKVGCVKLTTAEIAHEVAPLFRLGVAFMAANLMTLGAGYVVRVLVLRTAGVDAAGLYQAAWTMGALYVGFILGAMGADFYPRLTAVASDKAECNRIVNEQAEVGFLMAAPGAISTISFAGLVIGVLYSNKFTGAIEVLRWFCLGTMMQVITWPLGYVLLAKGKAGLFLFVDGGWTVVNVLLSWVCIRRFGVVGAGIAFFGSYVVHMLVLYPIVRMLNGFRWSAANTRIMALNLPLIAVTFCAAQMLHSWTSLVVGALAAGISSIYSVRALLRLGAYNKIPPKIAKIFVRLRFLQPLP